MTKRAHILPGQTKKFDTHQTKKKDPHTIPNICPPRHQKNATTTEQKPQTNDTPLAGIPAAGLSLMGFATSKNFATQYPRCHGDSQVISVPHPMSRPLFRSNASAALERPAQSQKKQQLCLFRRLSIYLTLGPCYAFPFPFFTQKPRLLSNKPPNRCLPVSPLCWANHKHKQTQTPTAKQKLHQKKTRNCVVRLFCWLVLPPQQTIARPYYQQKKTSVSARKTTYTSQVPPQPVDVFSGPPPKQKTGNKTTTKTKKKKKNHTNKRPFPL